MTTLCPNLASGLSGSPSCLIELFYRELHAKPLQKLKDPSVIQALFDTALVDQGTLYFSIPVQLDCWNEILT